MFTPLPHFPLLPFSFFFSFPPSSLSLHDLSFPLLFYFPFFSPSFLITHTSILHSRRTSNIGSHNPWVVTSDPIVGTPSPDDTWHTSLSGATPSGFPQEDTWRAPLSGLPQGKTHSTREHYIWTTAYPIRICCPDHWLKWACLTTSFR